MINEVFIRCKVFIISDIWFLIDSCFEFFTEDTQHNDIITAPFETVRFDSQKVTVLYIGEEVTSASRVSPCLKPEKLNADSHHLFYKGI